MKGTAKGDLYFGQVIQLHRQKENGYDLQFNAHTKTTTGKGADDRRHTNSPGYLLDITYGRKVSMSGFGDAVKFSSYLAFIAWQTNIAEQNDALGYNFMGSWFKDNLQADYSLAGFYGWQEKDDIPLVNRFTFSYSRHMQTYFVQYTHGIRDRLKHTFDIGLKVELNNFVP